MNNMNNVAFGAGKSGVAFDPITFITKPQVILRIICWICSLLVWACISLNGWHKKGRKEVCLFNNDNSACRLGSGVAFIGFLAALTFLGIEAVFQNLSSIKVRRRVVMSDVGFSGVWGVLFLITFGYLAIAWGKSDYPPLGKGINNCRAAIVFSFFSIGAWAACSWLAYQRWLEGADMTQFSSGFEPGDYGQPGMTGEIASYNADANYSAYTAAAESEPNYHSNPFTAMASQEAMAPVGSYQTPSY